MKKLILLAALAIAATATFAPPAEARVGVHVGIGVGGFCCGYYPGYYPGYYGYPGYYYVPPPPVVYAAPPAYYAAPAPAAVYAPAPVGMPANQASPTFTNEQGQTCREYQSNATVAGAAQQTYGTACLQPDGTWRVTQ